MPISANRAIAACKKNKDQKCHFFLPAQGLPLNTNEDDVHVWRTTNLPHVEIPVHQATVVPGRNTSQVLIVRTRKIKDSNFDDGTDEITVTVDDGGGSAIVDVVYYDENDNGFEDLKTKHRKQAGKKAAGKKAAGKKAAGQKAAGQQATAKKAAKKAAKKK
jgi:hypothetical protein